MSVHVLPTADESPTHPSAVARYLERSVAPGARGVRGVRLRTRGLIRAGRTWWPFRGEETTVPGHGYLRTLRVAGVLTVADSLVGGRARRHTRLLGRGLPDLVGTDLARADRTHAALSAMWVPAVLAEPSVRWSVPGPDTVEAHVDVHGQDVPLTFDLHREGLPHRIRTVRWGDPARSGFYRELPFGVEILERRTFGGLTVPSTGVLGWEPVGAAPRRDVLRFQVTSLEPLPAAPSPSGCLD